MEKNFDEAYQQLENIIEQIQSGEVPLEKLVDKIKEAKELIAYCENVIKDIKKQIDPGVGLENL